MTAKRRLVISGFFALIAGGITIACGLQLGYTSAEASTAIGVSLSLTAVIGALLLLVGAVLLGWGLLTHR
jgi:hypothetical protein